MCLLSSKDMYRWLREVNNMEGGSEVDPWRTQARNKGRGVDPAQRDSPVHVMIWVDPKQATAPGRSYESPARASEKREWLQECTRAYGVGHFRMGKAS